MNVRISICIPLYNGAKYLRQCIDSCLSQSFTDYEIVICDDYSTDEGPSIVENYVKKCDKIRFFRNEGNLGLVGNWNHCIQEARGEWIKFLFQDDFMDPGCLGRFIGEAKDDTILLVSRRHFVFEYEPSDAERRDYEKKSDLFGRWSGYAVSDIPARRIARYAARHMTINFIGEPSLTMFRRSYALDAGGFASGFVQLCDLDFLLRLASTRGLTYVPETLCSFRLHHSTTTSANIASRYYKLRFLEPLLLASRMVGDHAFAPVRAHWNNFHHFLARLFLNVRMSEANTLARSTGQAHVLTEFIAEYPFISREAKPSFIHRALVVMLLLKRRITGLLRS